MNDLITPSLGKSLKFINPPPPYIYNIKELIVRNNYEMKYKYDWDAKNYDSVPLVFSGP